MKLLRVIAGVAVLAGLTAGCAPKDAPIVNMPTPQEKAATLKSIANNPNMTPAMRQSYIYWLGKGTTYSTRGSASAATVPAASNAPATAPTIK